MRKVRIDFTVVFKKKVTWIVMMSFMRELWDLIGNYDDVVDSTSINLDFEEKR